MVSIIAFGKPCGGAKTLGWEHSNRALKDDFENLGIVLYSTEVLSGKCVLENGEKEEGGFMKEDIVYKCSPDQLTRATAITLVWDGA
jgi:hypothetical protein